MSLKSQTVSGILWNSVGRFSGLGVEFIVGIILARLLSPEEFGLFGMITIILSIANIFINAGFSQAIVRKQDCTQEDYSTAFIINLVAGSLLFGIIFLSAPLVSSFYARPELKPITQVMSLVLLIGSLSLIQQARLTKQLNFKIQSKITIASSVISGVVAIFLAYNGYGIWSLVYKTLSAQFISMILLWVANRWLPTFQFSKSSFKQLFSFGSKLLLSGIIGTLHANVSYAFIGKYFSAADLGYYTRAELFRNFIIQNVESVATTVGYPVLVTLQNDREQLKRVFRKFLIIITVVVAFLTSALAVTSEELILLLIGKEWLPTVPLLQLMCIAGVMYPVNSLNVNLLNVIGRSDLYLRQQTLTQFLIIPIIYIGYVFGLYAFIYGIIARSLFSFVIFGRYSKREIAYSLPEQFRDLSGIVVLLIFASVALIGTPSIVFIQSPIAAMLFKGSIVLLIIPLMLKFFSNQQFKLVETEISDVLKSRFKNFTKTNL